MGRCGLENLARTTSVTQGFIHHHHDFPGLSVCVPLKWPDGMRNRSAVESYVTVRPTAAVNNTPRKHSLCKHFEDVGASVETFVLSGCFELRLTGGKKGLW